MRIATCCVLIGFFVMAFGCRDDRSPSGDGVGRNLKQAGEAVVVGSKKAGKTIRDSKIGQDAAELGRELGKVAKETGEKVAKEVTEAGKAAAHEADAFVSSPPASPPPSPKPPS